MKKINWKNAPSTETPISAENLNKMQDNVEEDISRLEGVINTKNSALESKLNQKIDSSKNELKEMINNPKILSCVCNDTYVLSKNQNVRFNKKIYDTSKGYISNYDGVFKINKKCVLKISFSIWVKGTRFWLGVSSKNKGIVTNMLSDTNNGDYINISGSNIIVDVQSGDEIKLISNSQTSVDINKYSGLEAPSYITIEIIG